LFVLPDLDVPPKKGYQVRCLGIADALSDRYETRVIAARSTSGVLDTVTANARPHQRVWALLHRFVDGAPLQSALFDGSDVADRIQALARDWNPAAIVVVTERLPVTTVRLCADRSRPVIVDVVDSMRLHMVERALRARGPSSMLWRREARSFQRNSKQIAACASTVIAASTTALTDYPDARVITNAASPDTLTRPEAMVDLIFTGNLSYWPNVTAALELCERIVPKIRTSLPHSRIVIAGRRPPRAVQRACVTSGVELIANVDDMAQLLRRSRLALAPVEWTPGANLKILEALAAGTRVLAYPAAVRQLPIDVEGVRSCDGPDEMARTAVAVLEGELEIESPRRDRHVWPARAAELEHVLEALLAPPSVAASPHR
jgi:glycosyltransferase involved in cell wall biosynthesis